jgi:hypothetical protein
LIWEYCTISFFSLFFHSNFTNSSFLLFIFFYLISLYKFHSFHPFHFSLLVTHRKTLGFCRYDYVTEFLLNNFYALQLEIYCPNIYLFTQPNLYIHHTVFTHSKLKAPWGVMFIWVSQFYMYTHTHTHTVAWSCKAAMFSLHNKAYFNKKVFFFLISKFLKRHKISEFHSPGIWHCHWVSSSWCCEGL